MMNDKGTSLLFENMKNTKEVECEVKFKLRRVNFKSLIKSLILRGRFLFPMTCFVCYESDLIVLKAYECRVNLCELLKEDDEYIDLYKY